MEEKEITQKESIEIIAAMIQGSRNKLKVGDGNTFLLWGYITTLVSFSIYALYTEFYNPLVFWLWFLIPLLGWSLNFLMTRKAKRKAVVTYTDRIISQCWTAMGIAFGLCCPLLIVMNVSAILMPLTLILCGFGTAFTGIVIRDKWLIFMPAISFIVGIIMLGSFVNKGFIAVEWVLIFGVCFVFMMIIPGHILNKKSKRENA